MKQFRTEVTCEIQELRVADDPGDLGLTGIYKNLGKGLNFHRKWNDGYLSSSPYSSLDLWGVRRPQWIFWTFAWYNLQYHIFKTLYPLTKTGLIWSVTRRDLKSLLRNWTWVAWMKTGNPSHQISKGERQEALFPGIFVPSEKCISQGGKNWKCRCKVYH